MRKIPLKTTGKETIVKSAKNTISSFLKQFSAPAACDRKRVTRHVDILRWGLGFIYFWFGVLKFFPDLSSAEKLAGTTIEMMTLGLIVSSVSLPLLALWETSIGLALLTGRFQRAAIISLFFHVAGTFSPLVLLPEQTWNTPLVAASLEGQYIFKNLITIGAALVISAADGCHE
jgi:uncharacterized membrane protein YphA (DoxX/SURF4 family)